MSVDAREDGGQVEFLFGREEFIGDFVSLRFAVVGPAVLDLEVESAPAESRFVELADAKQGIGYRLDVGFGDVPELDYLVGGRPLLSRGDDAGAPALHGLELAAGGGEGGSRAVHFLFLLTNPGICGHWGLRLNCDLFSSCISLICKEVGLGLDQKFPFTGS